jgi:hypothetical protein
MHLDRQPLEFVERHEDTRRLVATIGNGVWGRRAASGGSDGTQCREAAPALPRGLFERGEQGAPSRVVPHKPTPYQPPRCANASGRFRPKERPCTASSSPRCCSRSHRPPILRARSTSSISSRPARSGRPTSAPRPALECRPRSTSGHLPLCLNTRWNVSRHSLPVLVAVVVAVRFER